MLCLNRIKKGLCHSSFKSENIVSFFSGTVSLSLATILYLVSFRFLLLVVAKMFPPTRFNAVNMIFFMFRFSQHDAHQCFKNLEHDFLSASFCSA
jgi:hypothetical protein